MTEAVEEVVVAGLDGLALIKEYGLVAWLEQALLLFCLAWIAWILWLDFTTRIKMTPAFWLWTRLGLLGIPGYLAWVLLDIWWI